MILSLPTCAAEHRVFRCVEKIYSAYIYCNDTRRVFQGLMSRAPVRGRVVLRLFPAV
jgi:hypothetical protein